MINEKVDVPVRLILSPIMTNPKQSVRQQEDIRKGILKRLANGGIRESELLRMFSDANMGLVRSIIEKMERLGQVRVDNVNGWNMVRLPPVEEPLKKEINIEPILPKVEPILPRIEPIERPSGVFVPDSPERLILGTLGDGARMRESLTRLVAVQLSSDDANKLLDRMIKSGIINETKSGRISLIHKYDHV